MLQLKQSSTFPMLVLLMLLISTKLFAQENEYQSARDYYFQLEDFVEPKVYLFENTKYPELGQYWKISSIPDSNFLKTEAYMLDFEQFESFKEQYDSAGSKLVEYIMITNSDSIIWEIKEDEVYRWNSDEEYRFLLKEERGGIDMGYEKTRKYQAINQMEILGKTLSVLRFKDGYTFHLGFAQHFRQQTFYSKEYGLVRCARFNETTKESETYILSKIYSEEEWLQLQE